MPLTSTSRSYYKKGLGAVPESDEVLSRFLWVDGNPTWLHGHKKQQPHQKHLETPLERICSQGTWHTSSRLTLFVLITITIYAYLVLDASHLVYLWCQIISALMGSVVLFPYLAEEAIAAQSCCVAPLRLSGHCSYRLFCTWLRYPSWPHLPGGSSMVACPPDSVQVSSRGTGFTTPYQARAKDGQWEWVRRSFKVTDSVYTNHRQPLSFRTLGRRGQEPLKNAEGAFLLHVAK